MLGVRDSGICLQKDPLPLDPLDETPWMSGRKSLISKGSPLWKSFIFLIACRKAPPISRDPIFKGVFLQGGVGVFLQTSGVFLNPPSCFSGAENKGGSLFRIAQTPDLRPRIPRNKGGGDHSLRGGVTV